MSGAEPEIALRKADEIHSGRVTRKTPVKIPLTKKPSRKSGIAPIPEIVEEKESVPVEKSPEKEPPPKTETEFRDSVKEAKEISQTKVDPKKTGVVPKGKCKSGRFWKSERDRFRSVIKSKGLKGDYLQRQKAKEDKIRARELQTALKEAKLAKIEDLKRRKAENKKRREENERKSEVVQIIKNPAKIKRMKKKQLRRIAKRDTLNMTQKS